MTALTAFALGVTVGALTYPISTLLGNRLAGRAWAAPPADRSTW